FETFAGFHAYQPVAGTKITSRLPDVCELDRAPQFKGRDVICGHPVRVHEHLNHARPTAHDVCPRDVLDTRQTLRELLCHAAERHVVRRLARERQCCYRDIVDLNGLDHPPGYSARHCVQIFVDLFVELDQASLPILADIIANGNDCLSLAAHGVN